jgi:hypothetical protein
MSRSDVAGVRYWAAREQCEALLAEAGVAVETSELLIERSRSQIDVARAQIGRRVANFAERIAP